MAIDMVVKDKRTGAVTFSALCTVSDFDEKWRPAANLLGLEMISAMDALWITEEFKARFIDEASTLRAWAESQSSIDPYYAQMAKTLMGVIHAVSRSNSDEEISFG